MNSSATMIAAIAAVGLAAFGLGASSATAAPMAFKGSRLSSQAHITLAKARDTALKVRGGVITDQELEQERGGSGLRYSFDIRQHGKTYEVGVDARTGAVLENDAEGKNPD